MLRTMWWVLNFHSWWLESCITVMQQVFRRCISWLYQTGWEWNYILSVTAVCLFNLKLVLKHISIFPQWNLNFNTHIEVNSCIICDTSEEYQLYIQFIFLNCLKQCFNMRHVIEIIQDYQCFKVLNPRKKLFAVTFHVVTSLNLKLAVTVFNVQLRSLCLSCALDLTRKL
jgi:hypothetical protein